MTQRDVVIIRLDAIGDFILWLDSARHFREIFPGRRITLIANSIWAEVARDLPYFDEVIEIPQSRYSGQFKFIKSLIFDFFRFKRWSVNIVIHPVISRTLQSDLIARWISSPIKIAPSGNDKNLDRKINKIPGLSYTSTCKWYSQIISVEKNTMELITNAQFMSTLSGLTINPQVPNLRDLLNLDKYQAVHAPKPYIVIMPGASNLKKAWPINQFAQIANKIHPENTIIICGSDSEKEITQTLNAILKNKDAKVINLGGKTNLIELISIISQSSGVIGNDSACIHIAASLGIPSTAILGGGHFGRFLPYKTNSALPTHVPKVIYHHMPCYGCNWVCPFIKPHMETWPCISAISTNDFQKNAI
jgi:ADP-heptose:LPS heptosyltransferase